MTIIKIPEGYKLVPKDKMTARMFDAAATNSEVGAFITGNWSESFSCVNELYVTAVNAMPDATIEVNDGVSEICFEETTGNPAPYVPTETKREPTMDCFHGAMPTGTFFAVYGDLSGAKLFTTIEGDTYIDCCDGTDIPDHHWFIDAGYVWFFKVDQSFAQQAMSQWL